MKLQSVSNFKLPEKLLEILEAEEYYEDESFEPIITTVEETIYKGEDMISYQAEFEILDEYEGIDGNEWEELIKKYVKEKEPELVKYVKGDSESPTCVIWTNSELNFKKILKLMIGLIENESEVNRIKKEASS